jgi:hypothetical protein
MLTVEIHQEQIPNAFREFASLIGERVWLEQATRLEAETRRNPFLNDYLRTQNRLVFSLAKCSQAAREHGGQLPWSLTGKKFLEAHAFIAQAIALIEAARKVSRKRSSSLIARIRDALRYSSAIFALQLEFRAATHFLRRGHSVYFPELGSGTERYDLLIETLGSRGLEVECKATTVDKGRKIHRQEAIELRHAAFPVIERLGQSLNSGLALVVTVPERLPEKLDTLLEGLQTACLTRTGCTLMDGTQIRVIDFDVAELEPLERPLSARSLSAIERISESRNRELTVYRHAGGRGIVVMVLQSAQPDSMLHEVFATMADAAGRQLTGTRPGMLMSSFEELSADCLRRLVEDEGKGGEYSPLTQETSAFLSREDFPYVVGVSFLSWPDWRENAEYHEEGGVSFHFPKRSSPFWKDDFSGMFGADPRILGLN